ncbi:MAG: hypothetical protein RLZZ230_790 [Candidatus Parcubacteria bacterium]|jgi:uncharacterized membrane protein (UPF0127 family)
MKIAERIVMVLLVVCFVSGAAWIYFSVQVKQQAIHDSVARGDFEIPIATTSPEVLPEDWQTIYPNVVPLTIGGVPVLASVAESLGDRIKGLSDTPFLPDNVVKLFVFSSAGPQSIWMKDMNYALDIIWIAKEGKIVHIEENVSPDSYPESFSSPKPAWYVVEVSAGFVAANGITLGEEVVLPSAGE